MSLPVSFLGDLSAASVAKQVDTTSCSKILGWVFFVPSLAISALTFYLGGRAFAAEIEYRKALVGIAANDGTTAYNQLIKTITFNPWFDTTTASTPILICAWPILWLPERSFRSGPGPMS